MLTGKEIAKNGMRLVNEGKVRDHKLGNSSRIHNGEVEKREFQVYRQFLPSKNGCMIWELTGSDNNE